MLLAISPAVLAMEIKVALVNARALRLVMLEMIHALLIGLKGYACGREKRVPHQLLARNSIRMKNEE